MTARGKPRHFHARIATTAVIAIAGAVLVGCTAAPADPVEPGRVELRTPQAGASVISQGQRQAAAIEASQLLFDQSPLVLVVDESDTAAVKLAGATAVELGVPVFPITTQASSTPPADLTPSSTAAPTALTKELDRLDVSRVVVFGEVAAFESGGAARTDVTSLTGADALDAAVEPRPEPARLGEPVAAVTDGTAPEAAAIVQAAGATLIEEVASGDILAAPDVISALTRLQPASTVLIGASYATQPAPDWSVRAAMTGYQLTGGGQRLFGSHRFVALYGVPEVPVLGVLGEQDITGTLTRATQLAAEYAPLSDLPVVPTLEIIATVASGDAGSDGNYSNELDPARIAEYVDAASAAGAYVVIDLQPGRSTFLSQAQAYQALLERPNVGLALDPEWRLGPDQVPLEQIGTVSADEINTVSNWLAKLVDAKGLPPKMFVLHEFRTSMITNREALQTDTPQLEFLVHVDGQGAQPDKQATYAAMLAVPPAGVAAGWKNFIDEDAPVLTPAQTMAGVSPVPDFISYQ
ncbi:hypothetical protein [Herbiconiux sp. VKM Ac-2851]|uniref:hypothetical protein n=1 Tax=Herbiconiux sp. VKM Ac-2851 TaxID=2739025 RepID=UPI001564552C|nr:hypothetical protein [Herbiconiux sp. VKM Ac-2851]NQX37199.1 hypothetical protein [Herbiconiux sp. VKM Ac-2851]